MNKDTGVTEDHTIREAKEILTKRAVEGFICPCCQQPAKIYRRKIGSSMAYGLILLYNAKEEYKTIDGYIHLEDFFKALRGVPSSIRGDLPKLRFWNLIEPKPGKKEDGNPSSGYYRLTWLGKEFVLGHQPVQKIITIYNNKRIGQVNSAGIINIHEALQNKFSYENLMKGEV